MRGWLNLQLFNILYYVMLIAPLVGMFGINFLANLFRTGISIDTIPCQICMRMDITEPDEQEVKRNMLNLFINLDIVVIYLMNKRVKKYVLGKSLNQKTFASWGGRHRRNLFNFNENLALLHQYVLCSIIEHTSFYLINQLEGRISKETSFILHQLTWFIFGLVINSLYRPTKQLVRSWDDFPELWFKEKPKTISNFYVRKPQLIPSRPSVKNGKTFGFIEVGMYQIEGRGLNSQSKKHFNSMTKKNKTHLKEIHELVEVVVEQEESYQVNPITQMH